MDSISLLIWYILLLFLVGKDLEDGHFVPLHVYRKLISSVSRKRNENDSNNHSQVTGDENLPNVCHEALGLLCLQLEYLPSF